MKQRGFTLIEMLIAIAVSSVLIFGIVATISQIYSQNSRATKRMVAAQNVENAGFWVERDALMAQDVPSTGFPLTMTWQDWDGNNHNIAYSLSGTDLQRTVSVTTPAGVTTTTQSTIAKYINIDSSLTNYQFSSGALTFKVTATVQSTNETRTYQIKLRPETLE